MAQEVGRWAVTAKETVSSEDNPCTIFVDKVVRNKYFSHYFGPLVSIIPLALHFHLNNTYIRTSGDEA
jgi:hypothetical protein